VIERIVVTLNPASAAYPDDTVEDAAER